MDRLPFGAEGFVLAESDDREYILSCMKETILASVAGYEKDLSELWISNIMSIISDGMNNHFMNGETFVLSKDGVKAGMLWIGKSVDQFTCDDIGYLLGIFVEKEFRGMGLGKELIRSAEHWCRCNNLLCLSLNVGAVNIPAVSLYEELGFEPQSFVMRKFL